MPFKSKAQVRACYAKNVKGWNCKEWSKATGNIKNLPERVRMKRKVTGMLVNPYGLKN